ncbi:hypothetical protein Lfu02_33290 [Longispora fulva]|uniref:Zn-dependent protease with chaperone function n=1 Tax=Longispora fulva TaxID=619741 RepID=A0A8J7KZY1_9ACTN|nr:M48 family metallopeptidase [Longispora fulva]MBG6141887.1 Zn-dependent protease with chaperone function [Longispora fulva]GIG58957.1 hypothetical protein Lfu02_33290 [Longispora fulva]
MVFRVQDFIHPLDRIARDNLEQVPGLRKLTDFYLRNFDERRTRQEQMSTMVRLGPRQLGSIYRLLAPICEAYGIEEPELFLAHGPLNAYTTGRTRTSIVIYSDLIERMPPEEIQAVLAHECAHILCDHVLYRSMAAQLVNLGNASKIVAITVMAVQAKLMDWYRKSELSADRAAIAFIGDVDVWLRVLMRFAGGVLPVHDGEYSILDFSAQAADYEALMDSRWERALAWTGNGGMVTHPYPAVRAREAQLWMSGSGFAALAAAGRAVRELRRCGRCGRPMPADAQFCAACGIRAIED